MNRSQSRRHQSLATMAAVTLLLLPGATAWAQAQAASPGIQEVDLMAMMTRGKLEADLGNYRASSEVFAAVASEEGAPEKLRWEALVRLGLSRSADGDHFGSSDAFREVATSYADDVEAIRFLTGAVASAVPGKVWIGLQEQFEDLLSSAEVISAEELMQGASGTKRVYLKRDAIELRAIFRGGDFRAQVAAYEIDKLLQLNMIPPVIERTIGGEEGSLQVWVEGCSVYKEAELRLAARDWEHQRSRMATFDVLINNVDRNSGNILVDPAGEVVLVDHSSGFGPLEGLVDPPEEFDRQLVERLRRLDRRTLEGALGDFLTEDEISGVSSRVHALLVRVAALIEERGEEATLF